MASKTMILRPAFVDSTDETLVSLVPSTTDMGSAYVLINEEVADDDSGYILCSAGGSFNSYFDYKRPSDAKNITGVSVKIRCKLESSQTNKVLVNSFTVSSAFSATNLTVSTDYADYELVFSDIDTIISELNSIENQRIFLTSNISSGTKYSPIRVTQIFIEIIYDAVTTEVYQKINGAWENLSELQYYKYSNNSWQLLSGDEFYDGQKYILQSS